MMTEHAHCTLIGVGVRPVTWQTYDAYLEPRHSHHVRLCFQKRTLLSDVMLLAPVEVSLVAVRVGHLMVFRAPVPLIPPAKIETKLVGAGVLMSVFHLPETFVDIGVQVTCELSVKEPKP